MSDTTAHIAYAEPAPVPAGEKWSPRKTLLFVLSSSAALWGLIITAAVQLF